MTSLILFGKLFHKRAVDFSNSRNIIHYVMTTLKSIQLVTVSDSAQIKRVRISICDAFLPSSYSIFKMVRKYCKPFYIDLVCISPSQFMY